MITFLGRTSNIHQKFISSRLYNQKFYSAFYHVNYIINIKKENEKCTRKKVFIKQCRHFSLKEFNSFYSSLYNSITTSDASILVRNTLIDIHDVTGFHWWETIFVTGVALKLLISLPIEVFQQNLLAKLQLSKIELDSIITGLKDKILLDAKRGRWTRKKAERQMRFEVRKHWRALVVKNNCHPSKSPILSLMQLPVWVLMSLSLRKMVSDLQSNPSDSVLTALEFQVGGVFWSPNLILPDSTLILPIVITLTSFALIEVNVLSGASHVTLLPKIFVNMMRIITLIVFPSSMYMPSCVTLYWSTSIMCGLALRLLLLSPRVKRFFRIPETPNELKKPYSHIATKFGEKCARFGKFFSGKS